MKKVFLLCFFSLNLYSQCINTKQINQIILKNNLEELLTLTKDKYCSDVKDSSVAKIYSRIADIYFKNNQLNDAFEYSKKATFLWQSYRKEVPKAYAYSLYDVGYFAQISQNYREAINYYKQSTQYYKKPTFVAYSYKLISDMRYALDDYDEQMTDITYAENLARSSSDYYLIADILNAKAIALSRLGNDSSAINVLNDALRNFEKSLRNGVSDDDLLANIHVNYGISYYNLSKFNDAKKHLQIAEKFFIKLKNYTHLAGRVFGLFALIETKRKNYLLSEKYSLKAIKILKNQKTVATSRLYLNRAANFSQLSDFSDAIFSLEKAIQQFPSLNLKKPNFEIIENKRTLLYIFRDYAINLTKRFTQTKSKKDLTSALTYFSHADHLLDIMRQEHQGQQSKSFWREHTRSLYESAIEASFLANNPENAYYFIEKSRAMLLLDNLKENFARKLLSIPDQKNEREFQQKLIELQLKFENKQHSKSESEKILSELTTTKLAFNEFKKNLEKKYPAYFQMKYDEKFTSLISLQKWIKGTKHEAFVEYFIGDSATYAMKITENQAMIYKLSFLNSNLSQKFRNACADFNTQNTSYNQFLSISNQLYEILVRPLNFPKNRIIISYDGEFIPFEALSKKSLNADYLVNQNAVSYTYSANFLLKSIETQKHSWHLFRDSNFLGVAPSIFHKSLNINNLPNSKKSIYKINDIFSGDLLIEKKAIKSEFLQKFPQYQFVQIYTHAFADSSQIEPIFYLQDDVIRLSELNQIQDLNTEMIGLSACQTGLGKNIKGEGIFSLARGFSSIGIPSLLTTLWNVDEAATYLITENFYKNLNDGMTKDVALQQAKITFLSQSNKNELPNLWASTIFVGDTSSISKSKYLNISIFTSIILLIFLSLYKFMKSYSK